MNRHQARIQQAVHDDDWQEFRKSLKGISTADKLDALQGYWESEAHNRTPRPHWLAYKQGWSEPTDPHFWSNVDIEDCDVCIRVDNYIKALCRGGQIIRFITLSYVRNVKTPSGKWRDVHSGMSPKPSIIRK
jgi:hypothetical protein